MQAGLCDLVGYEAVRRRVPWQTLASGEHWYLPTTFAAAAGRRLVDIFQPDVLWCGGITAAVKICHLAEANNISVIPHGSMNYPYGQHLAMAMPACAPRPAVAPSPRSTQADMRR